jgi:hypothetical protein
MSEALVPRYQDPASAGNAKVTRQLWPAGTSQLCQANWSRSLLASHRVRYPQVRQGGPSGDVGLDLPLSGVVGTWFTTHGHPRTMRLLRLLLPYCRILFVADYAKRRVIVLISTLNSSMRSMRAHNAYSSTAPPPPMMTLARP